MNHRPKRPHCQGSEELEQSQEKEYTVSIMARIGKTVSGARYLQDHENAIASFSKTDDIGVFMDNDSAVRWIFDGTSWTTEKSVFWKDKNQEHTFSCDCSNSSLPWQAEKYMNVNSDTYNDLFILLFYNSEGQNISLSVKIKMRTS